MSRYGSTPTNWSRNEEAVNKGLASGSLTAFVAVKMLADGYVSIQRIADGKVVTKRAVNGTGREIAPMSTVAVIMVAAPPIITAVVGKAEPNFEAKVELVKDGGSPVVSEGAL